MMEISNPAASVKIAVVAADGRPSASMRSRFAALSTLDRDVRAFAVREMPGTHVPLSPELGSPSGPNLPSHFWYAFHCVPMTGMSMRVEVVCGVILACAGTLCAGDKAQPLDVHLGLWEITTTQDTGRGEFSPEALAKLPPQQRAKFEEISH